MSIQIKITGLKEFISKLDKMPAQFENTGRIVVAEGATMVANEMRRNAHVVTGRMKGSIRVGYMGNNTATVNVGVPYAAFENRRAGTKIGFGPHNFADRAVEATRGEVGQMMRVSFREIFNS